MRFVFFFLSIYFSFMVFTQNSLNESNYISSWIRYEKTYPFICYAKNIVEWYYPAAGQPFFEKLSKAGDDKVTILHIGDSHVQSDVFTGFIRDRLQQIFGNGGRGFVFPYAVAKTNSAYDYYSTIYGSWEFSRSVDLQPRFPLSFSGITAYTTDTSAGFSLIFRNTYQPIKKDFSQLTFFCNTSKESMDFEVRISSFSPWIEVKVSQNNSLPYVKVQLPVSSFDTLFFRVKKNKPEQRFFELYAIIVEKKENSGILYISAGVNGAGSYSILKQGLASEHLKYLKPDLVILDIGINDIYRGVFQEQLLLGNLIRIIQELQSCCPATNIMLVSAQNVLYRNRSVQNCELYSTLLRKIARQYPILFYDYFTVAGGNYSMSNWYAAGLAQRDKKHLTFEGYRVRGELFVNALLHAYRLYLLSKPAQLTQEVFEKDTTRPDTFKGCISVQKQLYQATNQQTVKPAYYTVKQGDNLSAIATKFGVSVAKIKRWNNLTDDKIYPGQQLRVSAQNAVTSQQQKVTQAKTIVHVVQQGETLSSIAKKYNVTVDKIKKDNKLSTDKIVVGQKLILKF